MRWRNKGDVILSGQSSRTVHPAHHERVWLKSFLHQWSLFPVSRTNGKSPPGRRWLRSNEGCVQLQSAFAESTGFGVFLDHLLGLTFWVISHLEKIQRCNSACFKRKPGAILTLYPLLIGSGYDQQRWEPCIWFNGCVCGLFPVMTDDAPALTLVKSPISAQNFLCLYSSSTLTSLSLCWVRVLCSITAH